MSITIVLPAEKSRLRALLDHFAVVDDPREPWRVAHPLPEVLLLVVCGTIADCDDYEGIAEWGEAHLTFLRRFLPFHHGVPGARWLTILMNRIDPDAVLGRLHGLGPGDMARSSGLRRHRRQDLAAQPRSQHREGASSSRLGLRHHQPPRSRPGGRRGQDQRDHRHSHPARAARRRRRPQRCAGLDRRHRHQPCDRDDHQGCQADYLLAVKANQPTLRSEIETFFADAPGAGLESTTDVDKGHGRIEQRTVTVAREVDWLDGDRRFPGEVRLPDVATIVKVASRAELKDRSRFETRYYVSSAPPFGRPSR